MGQNNFDAQRVRGKFQQPWVISPAFIEITLSIAQIHLILAIKVPAKLQGFYASPTNATPRLWRKNKVSRKLSLSAETETDLAKIQDNLV
jgi:hypothetical protein